MSVVERTRAVTSEGGETVNALTSTLAALATEEVPLSEGASRAVQWFTQLSFLEKLAILTHTVGNLKSWRVLPTTTATAENAFEVISKNETAGAHTALLYYQAEPAGEGGVALNLVSDNKNNSTVFVTSKNSTHASIKLTHTNASGSEAGDAAAAMLNLNAVKGSEGGTTVQGLRIGSEEATPNSKGPFATFVRGTGGSLKNIFRFLPTAVLEMAEVESEPGTAESLHPFLFFKEGKLWIKVLGVATALGLAGEGIQTATEPPLQVTAKNITVKAEGITAAFIGPGAVTNEKILNSAVSAEKIESQAVTRAKIKEEAVNDEKVELHGLKANRLKEGELTNAYIKEKSLEGNRLAKETLGNEEIQTNAIDARTITAEAVALSEVSNTLLGPEPNVFGLRKLGTGAKEALPGNTKISELPGELTEYAKLPGRATTQTINGVAGKPGGTEGLYLKSSTESANPAEIQLRDTGQVFIKQGALGGVLNVKQIAGLESLVVELLTTTGKLKVEKQSLMEGNFEVGLRSPPQIEAELTTEYILEEAPILRLKSNKAVRLIGFTPPLGLATKEAGIISVPIVVLTNNGSFPITLTKRQTVEEEGKVEAETSIIKELPPSPERYVFEKVKSSVITSSSARIKTVLSETEVELTVKTNNVTPQNAKFKFQFGASKGAVEFATNKDFILEPGKAVGMFYNATLEGWTELFTNLVPAAKPAIGAENSTTVAVAGVSRTVNANIVGNNSTRTFFIRHNLGTLLPIITVKKEKGTGGSETTPGIVVTSLEDPGTVITENEVRIKFSEAGKPTAKEVYWVVING